LNDPWIASEQYKRILDLHQQKKFKFCGYMTMDSYNWLGGIDPHIAKWDSLITFTEFGAHEFFKAGINKPIRWLKKVWFEAKLKARLQMIEWQNLRESEEERRERFEPVYQEKPVDPVLQTGEVPTFGW
jgi:hypothetical protein